MTSQNYEGSLLQRLTRRTMNDPVTFRIPHHECASTNNMYKVSRSGHMYVSHEVKRYKEAIGWCLMDGRGKIPWMTPQSRLEVTLVIHARGRYHYDVDNVKAILDGMEDAAVYFNDSQIDALHIYRGDPYKEDPCIDVTVEEWRPSG